MSEQHIVNRVHQGPFHELEGKKINQEEAPTVDELPVYDVLTGETRSREEFNKLSGLPSAEDLDKVSEESIYADTVFTSAEPEALESEPGDNIGNLAPDPFGHGIDTAALYSMLTRPDLEFKKQVIAAFAHLGLDTRRHFGV